MFARIACRLLCLLVIGLDIASGEAPSPGQVPGSARFSDPLASGGRGPSMQALPAADLWTGTLAALWRNDVRPPAKVRVAHPLAVGVTEITVGDFRRFVSATGHVVEPGCWYHGPEEIWRFDPAADWRRPGFPQDDTHPVTCISWYDARAYLRWLSSETGAVYRFPTESEFEWFAGDGVETSAARLCGIANGADDNSGFSYRNHACTDGQRYTAPVASYAPNAHGLFDTRGNVWEWTEDCWLAGTGSWWYDFVSAPADGGAWRGGQCDAHPTRGGSYISSVANLEITTRRPAPAGYRYNTVGLRVVREMDAGPR